MSKKNEAAKEVKQATVATTEAPARKGRSKDPNSVASQIRERLAKGEKPGEIAKALGVKYQYVYTIAHPEVQAKARANAAAKRKAAKAA